MGLKFIWILITLSKCIWVLTFGFFSYNEKKGTERQYIGTQEWSHEDTHQVWALSVRIERKFKEQWCNITDVDVRISHWEIRRFSDGSEILKTFTKSTNTTEFSGFKLAEKSYLDLSDKWLVQYDEAWKEPNSLQNSNRSSRSQTFENHLRLLDRTRDSRKNSAVSEYGFNAVSL